MRKLAIFTGGFAAATALSVYLLGGVCLWGAAIAAAAAVPLFALRRRLLRRGAVFFLGAVLGFLWCSFYTAVLLSPADLLCGKSVPFTAVAAEHSEPVRYGSRVVITLETPGKDPQACLYFDDPLEISPGQRITGTAVFSRTALGFSGDGDLYEISRGVSLTARADSVLTAEDPETLSLGSILLRLSARLRDNLYAIFPEDAAAFFTALTVGDRRGLSYGLKNRLSLTGIYHAVSLSGMHISVLMGAVILLTGGRKRFAAVLGFPTLVLFVLMSGGAPATIRAVCMQAVLLLGLFVDREYDAVTALSAALLLLLLENPWSLTHWGLQLSFASSAGILLLMPPVLRGLKFRRTMPGPVRKLLLGILLPVFVTLSATAFSAPLLAVYFGMGSVIAPLTNLLCLWPVMLCFIGGIVLSFLTFLPWPAAEGLARVAVLLYRWVVCVTDGLSALPFAAVYWERPLLLIWLWIMYILPIVGVWLKPRRWLPFTCAGVTLLAAVILTPRLSDRITMLDVGQGQSILLLREEGAVLTDCGGNGDATGELVARHLLSHGVTKLHAVILTHFDSDHCDGMVQLLSRIRVDRLYIPFRAQPVPLAETVCAAAGDAEIIIVTEVMQIPLGQAILTVYPSPAEGNENDTGLSVLASSPECDILITGDLSRKAEAKLMSRYSLPDLEVLVAGHHGSADSTGEALLDALRPELVLISAGENNYSLPARQTLERISASGAAAYCTADSGNITIGW